MHAPNQRNILQTFFSTFPLSRIFTFFSVCSLFLLLVVILLSGRQYMLYNKCSDIIFQADRMLLQFTAIREHVGESLINPAVKIDLTALGDELQKLGQKGEKLEENILVSGALQAHIISQAELVDLLVQVKTVQPLQDGYSKGAVELSRTLNKINVSLQQMRLTIGDRTRAVLLGLNKIIIGTLALIIVICCLLLFAINRNLRSPLLSIWNRLNTVKCTQIHNDEQSSFSMDDLLALINSRILASCHLDNFFSMLLHLAETSSVEKMKDEHWQFLCSAISTNPDYGLVCVGNVNSDFRISDPECCFINGEIEQSDHLKYLGKLCRNKEQFGDAVNQSIQTGEVVVLKFDPDILPQKMQDYFANPTTSLCFSVLPIRDKHKVHAVLVIFTASEKGVSEKHFRLLGTLLNQNTNRLGYGLGKEYIEGDPTTIQKSAVRYLYTATGYFTSASANIITNLINGVINYTQQLIDIENQKDHTPEKSKTLQIMLRQEKKIAQYTGGMVIDLATDTLGTGYSPLHLLLKSQETIQAKLLDADSIELKINNRCSDNFLVPTVATRLAIITLIRLGHYNLKTKEQLPDKQHIAIDCSRDMVTYDQVRLRFTNSSEIWVEKDTTDNPIWPSLNFCATLLQLSNGNIIKEDTHSPSSITILLSDRNNKHDN